ncbi:hypothetical protein Tco_0433177 [Tanacetum coccineum]
MIESEVFDVLKISDNFFTYDTPLGMVFDEFKRLSSLEDNLFTYELGIVEDFYFPCIEQPHDNLTNDDLDVFEPRVCYNENEQIYVEAVILINKRLVRLIDITMEQWLDLKFGYHRKVDKEIMEEVCDSSNVDFTEWLTSKFCNHMTMDWYTKNALWLYWIRGYNEEVLTDEELSDLEEEKVSEEKENAEIFRIETDIFDFETPLCKSFKEFNHLPQIDVDVLTGDLPGFKTYEDYKDAWIYEWNREVHGHIQWPTCNSNENGYCNGGNLPGIIQLGNMTYFQNYELYDALEDGDLKDEALKEKKNIGGEKRREKSSDDAWSNHSPNDDNDAIQVDQERFDNHKLMEDDDDIMDLDDYLIRQNASYYVVEEEERFEERKSKLLGMPYEKPPTFKLEKFAAYS